MNDSYSNPTASHATASIQVQPEGAAMPGTVQGWTSAPPLPYQPDPNPPPRWFWIELAPRIRRRPRCDGEG